MELTEEQAIAAEVLADALLELSVAVRGFANLFARPAESFPAVVEAAAMAQPEPGEWTPELIERYRKDDISDKELHALPSWMHFAPEGYNWLEFKYFAPDGVELRSTLVKAAA